MKRLYAVLLMLSAASAFAREAGLDLYGYLVDRVGGTVLSDGRPRLGNTLTTRLKASWSPTEALQFHAEASFRGLYGVDNADAMLGAYGLPIPPRDDAHWELDIDHAYGRANLGPFDLVFGKQPIAWGTGYLFNPTARTHPSSLLGLSSEETPGILALAPSVALGRRLSLQGYLALQERTLRRSTGIDEGELGNLPWGIKLAAVLGPFDLSGCFLVETAYDQATSGFRRRGYLGADLIGALWVFGIHGEAALALPWPVAEGGTSGRLDLARDLELIAGLDTTVPLLDVEMRAEYYYRGAGAGRTQDYDVLSLISGQSVLLGRHYLFLRASRAFGYLEAGVSSLANLADGSWILLPELACEVAADLRIEAAALIPLGPAGSEFDGRYDLSALGLGTLDVLRPSAYLGVKLSF